MIYCYEQQSRKEWLEEIWIFRVIIRITMSPFIPQHVINVNIGSEH